MENVILGIILLVLYLILMGVELANYVMVSLSVYTLAKHRDIPNPWLAWIPVANYWMIGRLTNALDLQKGLERKWHVTLLSLTLWSVGLTVVAYLSLIVAGIAYSFIGYLDLLPMILPFYLLIIVAAVVAVALTICTAICIFKIFEATVPQKAVRYLLCFLLVPLGAGICLLKARNADEFQEIVEE